MTMCPLQCPVQYMTHNRDPEIPYSASFGNNLPSWPHVSYRARVKPYISYGMCVVSSQISSYISNAGMYNLEN